MIHWGEKELDSTIFWERTTKISIHLGEDTYSPLHMGEVETQQLLTLEKRSELLGTWVTLEKQIFDGETLK